MGGMSRYATWISDRNIIKSLGMFSFEGSELLLPPGHFSTEHVLTHKHFSKTFINDNKETFTSYVGIISTP